MGSADQKEVERLAAVDRYDLLDTPRERLFDGITRLTCRLLDVPMAALSAIDAHRQWYKASEGLVNPQAPRNETICTHTLATGGLLVLPDVAGDPRFAGKPWVVGEPQVRSYAGIPLRSPDGFNIGTLCAFDRKPRGFTNEQIANLTDLADVAMEALEYRLLANTDPLTNVLSRRAFKEATTRAVGLALRHGTPLSVIAMDLDHFKAINDSHGHAAGDIVLAKTVGACVDRLRATDISGRLGGEEFAFVLPHTERAKALNVAEQLQRTVARLPIPAGGRTLNVTASFGVAAVDAGTRDVDHLLRKADEALYRAKSAGRNQCKAAPVSETESRDMQRVFMGGQIILTDGNSLAVDCTVRALSDLGADIDVTSSSGLPETFVLSIRSEGVERPSRVVSRGERRIEVEFMQEK